MIPNLLTGNSDCYGWKDAELDSKILDNQIKDIQTPEDLSRIQRQQFKSAAGMAAQKYNDAVQFTAVAAGGAFLRPIAGAGIGIKLTGGGSKILKDPALQAMKESTVAESILARGGGAGQIRQVATNLQNKSLGEVANLAAAGDTAALSAIKIVKQAAKKAQKYGGK